MYLENIMPISDSSFIWQMLNYHLLHPSQSNQMDLSPRASLIKPLCQYVLWNLHIFREIPTGATHADKPPFLKQNKPCIDFTLPIMVPILCLMLLLGVPWASYLP